MARPARPGGGAVRIAILAPDASGNCMGRAHVLARALEPRHAVSIVGPEFGDGVWEPLRGEGLDVRTIPFGYPFWRLPELRRLDALVEGDVLLASKPLATSFGVARRLARARGLPLLLDVDDWESGFVRARWEAAGPGGRLRQLASSALKPQGSLALWNGPRLERRAGEADAVTVSNRFLQERFGGTLVRHGRDVAAFDPARVDAAAERARRSIAPDERVVAYFGTIAPYKGVDDLVDAVARIPDPAVRLLLIGVGDDRYSRAAVARGRSRLGDRCRTIGRRPLAEAPRLLALADVVAIPQRDTPATRGQMPAKLFDAMAAGRPTVATAVSDIPEALGGCGWVVPPGDPPALAAAIAEALADPAAARERGARARARAIERFSWEAMGEALEGVLAGLTQRSARKAE